MGTLIERVGWSSVAAWLAAGLFAAGLLLPAGLLADSDGILQSATGVELLSHAAFVAFPLAMFAMLVVPVALQAMLGRSRRARLSTGVAFLLVALVVPVLCATACVSGASVAWAAGGVVMATAAVGMQNEDLRIEN